MSPFGSWRVVIDRHCLAIPSGFIIAARNFSLEQRNINVINIAVDPQPNNRFDIHVSRPGNGAVEALAATAEQLQASPNEVSVDAWLGDSNNPSVPESDVFSFEGRAGDRVTVRLEADTRRGNNGGEATLRFVDFPAQQKTGTLPRSITFELPEARRYRIAVEQPTGGGEKDYRGGYILRVESAQGAIKALAPDNSVEK